MSVFENISLSRNTITRRVEDIGGDLMTQLQIKSKTFKCFFLALDESTDVSDTVQLLIFIRGIDTDYNITEELASLESISGTTKGADIFEKVNFCIENLGLTWEKLCSITTDGAPNMVERNTGLVGRIAQLTTSKMIETPIFLHCIIHQQFLKL
uniref:General transcription factor II-I repeat domain-containing protein 2B n=1 Tax=Schizaphis graminum TaxID=13262 RepID=A0A2S2NUF0_SCHGA